VFIDVEALDKIEHWLDSDSAREGDRTLFRELVRRFHEDCWHNRWFEYQDMANDCVVLVPRRGMCVRLSEEPVNEHQLGIVIIAITEVPDDEFDDPWPLP
jgi:hypothetical protein